MVLTLLFLSACGAQAEGEQSTAEPQLKVTVGGQELKVIYYGDHYNETRDEINKRLKQAMEETSLEELPYVPLWEEIAIEGSPDVGNNIGERNGSLRPIPHPAAFLSSNSADYEPGRTIRGIVVRADINGAPFAFAFILRTDAGELSQTGTGES